MLQAEVESSRHSLLEHLRDLVASYASQQPVRQVAVVGNAPMSADAERARLIDSSDLVFRINAMALDTPSGPPSVGSRCHVVILSRYARITPWTFEDYRRRLYLTPQAGYGLRYILHPQPNFWPADLGLIPIPNAPAITHLLDLLDPTHEPNSLIPTSGTIATYLAHEFFPEAKVLVTGLSYLDGNQQEAWQYHSGGGSPVIERHKLGLEAKLLGSWVEDGSLQVLT